MPVFLRDPSDTSGALRKFDSEEDAEQAVIDHGYEYATDEEVSARDNERKYGGDNARAFLDAAAAGAMDAAVAIPRTGTELLAAGAGALGATDVQGGLREVAEQLSGRKFLENVNAVVGELSGQGTAEAIAHDYSEEARNIARANPNFAMAGHVGGQLLGGLGLSGAASSLGKAAASAATSSALGRSVLGLATEGAVEGAALGAGEASEQAFIANEKLTSEQVLGSIGIGSLIGGGAGGVLGGGGYGAGAVYRKGAAAAEAASERVRNMFGPRVTASAETVGDVAGQALGATVDRAEASKIKHALEALRDKAEHAQAAATGADIETIQDYGALRWDGKAISGRDAYINREALREGAKRDLAQGLQAFVDSADPVIDEVRYAGLKLDHIRQSISGDAAEQLAEAGRQADRLEAMVTPMRKPGSAAKATREAGKDLPIDREAYVATFDDVQRSKIDDEIDDEIREALEELGKDTAEGTRSWKRVEQDVLKDRVGRQAPPAAVLDPNEGSLRAELGSPGVVDEVNRFISRNVAEIRKTTDPAVANSLLDQTKRGLQKYAHSAGLSAEALVATSPERALLARKRSDYLERFQEPLRQSLENEAVWGKAATNQKAINAAITRYVEGSKAFQGKFIHKTSGYRGLGGTRVVRPEATSSFINKLGLAENEQGEQFLRAHLRATNDVLSAIDDALELGEKKALVGRARETEKALGSMLDRANDNIRVANRIEALVGADADGDGGMSKAFMGSLIGGPVGAAIGFAADVATSPGKRMRQAIAIQRIAKRNDVDIEKAVARIFGQGKKTEAKAAAEAASATGEVANDIDALADDEVSGVRLRPGLEPDPGSSGARVAVGGGAAPSPAPAARVAAAPAPSPATAPAKRSGPSNAVRAAVPASMAAFLGTDTDKQKAFRARAREIHQATANYGEGVRDLVDRDLGDIPADFPRLSSAITNGLTRGALFLESKLPSSYRAAAPGAIGRSTRPVADHDIAKFARYWSAVNSPLSVLHDMALGIVTDEQIEAVRAVYPELHVKLSEQLLERAAELDAQGVRLPIQTRLQIGRFVGVQIEPAFGAGVLDMLDQARQGAQQATEPPTPRPSAPPDLAQSAGPESMQIQQREARVG